MRGTWPETIGSTAADAIAAEPAEAPRQGQGRSQPGRQVPAGHFRPDLSPGDTALGYKNLLEAEHGFRDLKSELLLRPVFHRLERRICAHVLICWLALLLTSVAERSCDQSWRNICRETARLKQVTLTGQAATMTQNSPLRPEQKTIYQALSITPPPLITAFDPA